MEIIKGGVTAAQGFEAACTAAGLKYKDRTDMALVYSQVPCVCAGTFTTNVVKAAPVKWDQKVVKGGKKSQAVIVNSGIANACTGEEGYGYCQETAQKAAEVLGVDADHRLHRCDRQTDAYRETEKRNRSPGGEKAGFTGERNRCCKGHHDHRYS